MSDKNNDFGEDVYDTIKHEPGFAEHQTSRRTFLGLLSFAGAGKLSPTGSTVSGGYAAGTNRSDGGRRSGTVLPADSSLPGSNSINLGEEGLSDGENISPYIDQYFVDDTNVFIPSGSYRYDGSGLEGRRSDAALVGSDQGVEFYRPDDDTRVAPDINADAGTVRVENITIRGKKPSGPDQSRWRFGALAPDSRCEAINVNHPDGTENGTDSSAFLVYDDHRGTAYFKNCYVKDFGNAAFYVNLGYREDEQNPVVIDNCVVVDSNGAVRGGHNGSKVTNSTFVWRNQPPTWHRGGSLARGIRSDHDGYDMAYENNHFYFASGLDAGRSIDPESQEANTSGNIEDIYIRTEGEYGGVADRPGWSYENINITGSGSASAPVESGDKKPDLKLEDVVWMPEPQTVYPGGDYR